MDGGTICRGHSLLCQRRGHGRRSLLCQPGRLLGAGRIRRLSLTRLQLPTSSKKRPMAALRRSLTQVFGSGPCSVVRSSETNDNGSKGCTRHSRRPLPKTRAVRPLAKVLPLARPMWVLQRAYFRTSHILVAQWHHVQCMAAIARFQRAISLCVALGARGAQWHHPVAGRFCWTVGVEFQRRLFTG